MNVTMLKWRVQWSTPREDYSSLDLVFLGGFHAALIELSIISALKMTLSGGYSPLIITLVSQPFFYNSKWINYDSYILDEYATLLGNVSCIIET